MKRRTALGLLGAAAGLATVGAGAAPKRAAKAAAPDLADPAQLARAYRKLAYSFDERITYWWMRGTRYGVVDSVATPFWDMYVGAWFRTRSLTGDDYEVTIAGANFYTPPNSTELLETFRNPYTGQTVPVRYAPPRAMTNRLGPAGGSAFGGDIPGMKTTKSDAAGPGWVEGDEVYIKGDMILNAVPLDPASGQKPLAVADLSTYIGRVSDVVDPKVLNAPAAQSFIDILTWPKWLQMGDQPGTFVSHCYGRKVFAYEQMPATWRTLFARALPEAARDHAALVTSR